MDQSKRIEEFKRLVYTKFNIYNSLFLNLPYRKVFNVGLLIPLMHDACKQGLDSGKNPEEILESFFGNYAGLETEKEKIDFMFRVIQYVERQVVLFDSVEEAAFPTIQELGNDLSIKDFFQLLDSKKNWDSISGKLSTFSARIVFTAHPTQFYPPSVLDIITRLSPLIAANNIDEIDLKLQQLGLTSLINSKKPTPLDEAKNIIYYLINVYYDAMGDLYAYIKENISNNEFDNPNIIKLGFWPGGDRDGNPFVTSKVTSDVANELRMSLMKCYYKELKDLQQKLSFRELEDYLSNLRDKLYETTYNPDENISFGEIMNPLIAAREILVDKYHGLYLKDLDNFMDKIKIFRTHFATLDIRQDHRVHRKVVEAILQKEGIISNEIDELDESEFMQLLLHKDFSPDAADYDEEIIQDTLKNISQLKSIQDKNGEEGCNRYIISNSEDKFSVLFVYALFRWCGWEEGNISFDIIPLFETMIGMNSSEQSMQELFDIPEYKAHIIQRNSKQTIMLGFSDGTKDGGYMKANWSILETKENLSAVCERNNIKAIFFDGRGGPPARGGGKTHRFYAAQSQGIANHEIQMTVQGQTITSKYGTKEQFINNCEQLLTAGLSKDFSHTKNEISGESRKLIGDMANLSYEKYTDLKNHKMFIPYLENKSTLRYYGKANIGSRPGKRGDKKNLELADLRAISFVGSWSQLKQNVPGYFGTGTALKTLAEQGKLESLKMLFKEVPVFKALMLNSMMSLAKSNFSLTAYMKEDEEYKDFWNILYEEYKLSKEMLLLITGYGSLMEEEPISRESIQMRDKIVLPLLLIQQYSLQKISKNTNYKELYEKLVTRSLYGNINASRNSA
ncbi:MAG: phosphoenolpyruvate carboxylase [Bacteroidales bacterium]|nr:phosphoenolpyruvate carboxylase [Bacteroidales bacterium]MCF8391334.1 phosphoenolpyruvate carboxylase [Bacteroidales bacterium]